MYALTFADRANNANSLTAQRRQDAHHVSSFSCRNSDCHRFYHQLCSKGDLFSCNSVIKCQNSNRYRTFIKDKHGQLKKKGQYLENMG